MKKFIKIAGVVLACSIALCGCGKSKIFFSTGLTDKQVFKIGGSVCSLPEAMIVLTTDRSQYEQSYGADIWDKDCGGITMQDYVKDNVKDQLARLKTLSLLAEKKDITLSGNETDKIKKAANEYFSGLSKEEIEYMGIKKADVESLYSQYALAAKVYDKLTEDINPEVSDAEAKMIKVESIFVKTYTMDADGNKTVYSEDEKAKALKKVKSLQEEINLGGDFTTVAQNNTDADEVEYIFGKGDMVKEFEDAAFSLASGEMSDIIDTEDGYYMIRCVSDYMEDETEKHKQDIIQQAKDEAFKDIYDPYVESLSSEFNDKLWDGIEFKANQNINNVEFYDIFETTYNE